MVSLAQAFAMLTSLCRHVYLGMHIRLGVVVAPGAQIAPAAELSLVQPQAQQQRIGGVALKRITQ